ncbi:ATP/GTP-binding protein [Aestuariimicrobium sp. T2.26MG-19.2B]|uniref:ATP/GTP-binding protein n=1 Tax=Aestuariimicrobium sp. T2.26MG-19.2B TaxID=3040679 RepID=UPI002541789F|nr:ATP/GTP-binding protein [Aestuariimicrobium sp. T2.26MG-19.2B]
MATSDDLAAHDTSERGPQTGTAAASRRVKPSWRGWFTRGGGRVATVEPVPEWRGTTVQVCGLWPFSGGAGMPDVGVPMGHHLATGATVSADPISWFTRGLINTPSAFVLGRPGLGKSSLIRHMVTGLADQGVWTMVLGDIKPDYPPLVEALGGQVISLSRSAGTQNPLDLMGAFGRITDLPAQIQDWAMAQLVDRQTTTLHALLTLVRGSHVSGAEVALLAAALNRLQRDDNNRPVDRDAPQIRDVIALFADRDPALRLKTLAGTDDAAFDQTVRDLRISLMGLLSDGPFGGLFDGPTTTQMNLDRPVVFDVHDFENSSATLQAAVLLTCWAYGSASTGLATHLADQHLGPRRRYLLVMDELWRTLRASADMVDRVDEITRLNRQLGVGQILCTHTMQDLKLGTPEQTARAWGFVERSSMVFLGGLSQGEFGNLSTVFALSQREQDMITDWSGEGSSIISASGGGIPPGRGKFLLKLGKRPGIPFRVALTPSELAVNDTNRRWVELTHNPALP